MTLQPQYTHILSWTQRTWTAYRAIKSLRKKECLSPSDSHSTQLHCTAQPEQCGSHLTLTSSNMGLFVPFCTLVPLTTAPHCTFTTGLRLPPGSLRASITWTRTCELGERRRRGRGEGRGGGRGGGGGGGRKDGKQEVEKSSREGGKARETEQEDQRRVVE